MLIMNMRIARRIRSRGLNTHLDSNSFIASGAVDLFLIRRMSAPWNAGP